MYIDFNCFNLYGNFLLRTFASSFISCVCVSCRRSPRAVVHVVQVVQLKCSIPGRTWRSYYLFVLVNVLLWSFCYVLQLYMCVAYIWSLHSALVNMFGASSRPLTALHCRITRSGPTTNACSSTIELCCECASAKMFQEAVSPDGLPRSIHWRCFPSACQVICAMLVSDGREATDEVWCHSSDQLTPGQMVSHMKKMLPILMRNNDETAIHIIRKLVTLVLPFRRSNVIATEVILRLWHSI